MNQVYYNLCKTHKNENIALQKTIQQLKRSVPLNDKKNRKDVMAQITTMEEDLKKKHMEELKMIENSDYEIVGITTNGEKKVSRAQRRKEKKEQIKDEMNKEFQKDDLENEHLIKQLEQIKEHEMQSIEEKLSSLNACLYQIQPDGDCLYNSIAHQMQLKSEKNLSAQNLRSLAADYLKAHFEEFSPFMPDIDSHEDYNNYCEAVKSTNVWGGQIEIQALSQALEKPIDVIQSDVPTLHVGHEYTRPDNPPLTISYHRYLYSLGEHYNSVCSSSTTSNS